MTIIQYAEGIRTKSRGKVKAPIAERWNTRILPRGLHTQGKDGARAYLESYGKNIAAPKVAELATCAEIMGATEMAAGFWEVAYELETGSCATFLGGAQGSGQKSCEESSTPIQMMKPKGDVFLAGIPNDLQPGKVIPMQPKDAAEREDYYVGNPMYQAQPKRDGQKDFLFGSEEGSAHQSRSTSIMGGLTPEFEHAVQSAAKEIGAFVLEGERYYLSAGGSEHRTAAQAATANIEAGAGEMNPIPVYGGFRALYSEGTDLREVGEDSRVEALKRIVTCINSYLPKTVRIEAVETAYSEEEKRSLLQKQKLEGREGVVWTERNCNYTAGDQTEITCRTKFLQEKEFIVTAITHSKTANRRIASMDLADESGKFVGKVGTGFDDNMAGELIRLHEEEPGSVKVLVRFQGWTEKKSLWHPRVIAVAV